MRRLVGLVAVFALLAIAAIPGVSRAQDAPAQVRIMHASPDAPAVDVYVNGERVLANVPFFAVSPYLSLPAGTYSVQVTPAGAGTDQAVLSGDLEVGAGEVLTVAAIDTLANIDIGILEDDNSPTEAGTARVRVFHASPDAPAVDIKIAGTDTAVLEGAEFGDYAYLDVPAGTYQFDITPAGADTVVFTTPELLFLDGWVYTLTATGLLGQNNLWVQARVDAITR
jgi:hypothetical protein